MRRQSGITQSSDVAVVTDAHQIDGSRWAYLNVSLFAPFRDEAAVEQLISSQRAVFSETIWH